MGAAYVNRDWMSDLKVMRRVSLLAPQVVPARARRILRRGVARVMIEEMCGEKVKWGSKVTPRMQGLRFRGRVSLSRETAG